MRQTLFVLFLLFSVSTSAQGVPTLIGRVVDNAEILSPQTETTIILLLENHEQETSNQVTVLTIPTLGGESIESYANRVFRTWGLGRADVNNGVLLLIAKNDRELRIEVGYGLEGSLTDAEAGRIIRNVIVPMFRSDDFEGGTLARAEIDTDQDGRADVVQYIDGGAITRQCEDSNADGRIDQCFSGPGLQQVGEASGVLDVSKALGSLGCGGFHPIWTR